jgi:ABC-type sugar transport system permease subunit
VLVTFYNSLHTLRMDLGMLYEYVGLEHFREILTTDDVFWKAARNSLVWAWWRRSWTSRSPSCSR